MSRKPPPRTYPAFGESKTLYGWSRDPRCPVGKYTLRERVVVRGMTVEAAFGQGPNTPRTHVHEAFGERRTLAAWARDPRCPVKLLGLYYRVLRLGLGVEQAFALGPFDRTRTDSWKTRFRLVQTTVTAWGEARTAEEWAADPRAAAPARLIADRVRRGYPPEDAISKTPRELGRPRLIGSHGKHFFEAFGERKTLNAWSRDPRCRVSRWGFYCRVLRMGLTVEEALARGPGAGRRGPARPGHKKLGRKPRWATVTAWGETKPIEEWAADPRSTATPARILSRLRRGYSPEQAISRPKYAHRPKPGATGSAPARRGLSVRPDGR